MSKKTFTTAPKPKQPSLEEMEAYEKGGAGHDSTPVAPSVVYAAPVEAAKRLSLDLPTSVHTRFKTACSATGRKMVAEIQDFIERRATELEAEAGIARK